MFVYSVLLYIRFETAEFMAFLKKIKKFLLQNIICGRIFFIIALTVNYAARLSLLRLNTFLTLCAMPAAVSATAQNLSVRIITQVSR